MSQPFDVEHEIAAVLSDSLFNGKKQEITEVCQLQKFMEQQALDKAGVQVQGKPLFISCPCKRCSPFTL